MIQRWDFIGGFFSQHKRRRLRHLDRIDLMVQRLRRHDYIVVLGPAHSEKTRLLDDVAVAGV